MLHLFNPNAGEHLRYETFNPARPNSHVAAGGCSACRPDKPLTPVQQRECERIFADEGLAHRDSLDFWEDSVVDDCIKDIVITGEVSTRLLLNETSFGASRNAVNSRMDGGVTSL